MTTPRNKWVTRLNGRTVQFPSLPQLYRWYVRIPHSAVKTLVIRLLERACNTVNLCETTACTTPYKLVACDSYWRMNHGGVLECVMHTWVPYMNRGIYCTGCLVLYSIVGNRITGYEPAYGVRRSDPASDKKRPLRKTESLAWLSTSVSVPLPWNKVVQLKRDWELHLALTVYRWPLREINEWPV